MVVIALELLSLSRAVIYVLYALQDLIKLLHGFVNHIHSNARDHLGT